MWPLLSNVVAMEEVFYLHTSAVHMVCKFQWEPYGGNNLTAFHLISVYDVQTAITLAVKTWKYTQPFDLKQNDFTAMLGDNDYIENLARTQLIRETVEKLSFGLQECTHTHSHKKHLYVLPAHGTLHSLACSLWSIINSLVLLRSTNSHLFPSTSFSRWVKKKKRKNRSSGRDFVLLSAEQTARRQWRPSRVCGRNSSQVLMITWADDNSVIMDLLKKLLSSRE